MKIFYEYLKVLANRVEEGEELTDGDLRELMAATGQMLMTKDDSSTIRLEDVEGKPYAYLVSKESYEDSEAAQAEAAIHLLESTKD